MLDVKVGNGSFNSTIQIAEKLAKSLVNVAKGADLKCEALITDMNQVLGKSAGHSLEVIECIEYLTTTKRDKRLEIIIDQIKGTVGNAEEKEAWQEIKEHFSDGLADKILEVKARFSKNTKVELKSPEEIEFDKRIKLLELEEYL